MRADTRAARPGARTRRRIAGEREWAPVGEEGGIPVIGWFRAIAVDFDGTLTDGNGVGEDILSAVAEARQQGRKVILVTGRILEELRDVFPSVDEWFDAIVAENGAVITIEGVTRLLAAPVELELDAALVARAIPFRRGQALVATHAWHEAEVMEEMRHLGLECSLVRNRGEMMVLPPGISKGFGIYQALRDLGVSHHSTVAFGDAENDHSLLRTCELGVAVANAVESLRRHADVVLEKAGGAGVAEFLRGPVLRGESSVVARRWQVDLGCFTDGGRVLIPASQINVLIVGRSNSGKSFLAGLLAEKLILLGYSLCVIDPEGDHPALGRLRGTLALGGGKDLPSVAEIGRMVEHRFGSLLLDLSLADSAQRERYALPLLAQIEKERRDSGLPHWIVLDEAHQFYRQAGIVPGTGDLPKGYCFVTYRPHELSEPVLESIDVVLALPGGSGRPEGHEPDPLATLEKMFGLDLVPWRCAPEQQALLARPRIDRTVRAFTMSPRSTQHVRHWHKYFDGVLPPALRFQFRDESGALRHVAGNIGDLHRILATCEPGVILFHATRGDLSHWLRDGVQDLALAQTVHTLERMFSRSPRRKEDVEALRFELLRAIERRYVESSER